MRKYIIALLLLAVNAYSQTVLYGVDVPIEIENQVSAEEEELKNDTALFLERKQRFEKYRQALHESEKEHAIKAYKREKFPKYPPELIVDERKQMFEYEESRKKSLFEIGSVISTITIDPLKQQIYSIPATVGEPTRLLFFDQTGEPWPVTKSDHGKGNRFKADVITDDGMNNQVSIQLEDSFVEGNVLVNLQDYGVPIVIRIVGNPTKTTPYANFRVSRYGPNANKQFITSGPMSLTGCQDVYKLLENSYIPGARRLKLSGVKGNVFETDKYTYFKTQYRVVFPPTECPTSDGNGNFAARVASTGLHTTTMIMDNMNYETVRIIDDHEGGAWKRN